MTKKLNLEKIVPSVIQKRAAKSKKNEIIGANYPYDIKMDRGEYENDKEKLQIEILKLQKWVKTTGQKIMMVFEGRDAA